MPFKFSFLILGVTMAHVSAAAECYFVPAKVAWIEGRTLFVEALIPCDNVIPNVASKVLPKAMSIVKIRIDDETVAVGLEIDKVFCKLSFRNLQRYRYDLATERDIEKYSEARYESLTRERYLEESKKRKLDSCEAAPHLPVPRIYDAEY